MTITEKEWKNYISKLGKLSKAVSDAIKQYIEKNGLENPKELIAYSYALVTKYGNGAAALSAQMYDVIAQIEGRYLEAAAMAPTATYGDIARAVYGTLKESQNAEEIAGAVSRWVKTAGADTTLQNAARDGAEFAWIPSGDTCAFCIALAGNGWQRVSKQSLKNGHAEHIHSNCDCQYCVRFDERSTVAGYNPEEYHSMYQHAEGHTPQEKINAMRREFYQEDKDHINEQKRDAYEKRKELESPEAEEIKV